MTKDSSILDLIERLPLREKGWIIVDNWDADLCAVGVALKENPRRLIYIGTFGKGDGRYDFEYELPVGPQSTDFVIVDRGHDVDELALLEAIMRHLKQ